MTCPLAVPLLVLVLGLVRVAESEEDPLLPFTEYLDQEQLVTLRWGFDRIQGNITFELSVNTTGWIGFGLSPNGGMAGSDIVIGGQKSDGYYFGDYHAEGKSMPLLDKKQSYNLLCLTEADGQTTMRFERTIQSCDEDDRSITELPVKLIYAYGLTDDVGYHKQHRGSKELNLLQYLPRSTLTNSHYFDMTMTNFSVPAVHTHYECRVMSAPSFAEKHHIYRVQPLIEHLDLVHHLLLYKCPPHMNKTFQGKCYESKAECYHVMAAWGVGGGDFEVPRQVGIPIGGDEGDNMYRLEIHYNNPNLVAGRVDSSGLRFHYTSELRKHDAGVLMTGLSVEPMYGIPPNTPAFHVYGVCDTSIIPQTSSETGPDLQIFASALHTHLAGRKIRVGHFSNGKQLGFVDLDEHYNFEYQQAKNLGNTKTIKMGDSLLVECTYDTSNRTGLTWGGLATTDEMCLAFLFYYPATNLSHCVSFPDLGALMDKLEVSDHNELYTKLLQKTWDEEEVTEYETTLKSIPQNLMIIDRANHLWHDNGKISDMMESPTPTCERAPTGVDIPNTSNMAQMSWTLLLSVWLVCTL